jgi:protein tyrosine phosphatase
MSEQAFARLEAEALLPATLARRVEPVNQRQAYKNRYNNILPTELARVKLDEKESRDGSDYINADWLRPEGLGLAGVTTTYIATQAPLPHTQHDFWQMVCETNTRVIVTLTAMQDRKAETFWPTAATHTALPSTCAWAGAHIAHERSREQLLAAPSMEFDECLAVILLGEQTTSAGLIVRTFQVVQRRMTTDASGTASFTQHHQVVRQVHFEGWPDYGVPHAHDFALVMSEYRRALELARFECDVGQLPPAVVVHCSAGVGRTGTFLAIDLQLQQAPAASSLEETVRRMRACRHGSVQTLEQYAFAGTFVASCRARGAWTK